MSTGYAESCSTHSDEYYETQRKRESQQLWEAQRRAKQEETRLQRESQQLREAQLREAQLRAKQEGTRLQREAFDIREAQLLAQQQELRLQRQAFELREAQLRHQREANEHGKTQRSAQEQDMRRQREAAELWEAERGPGPTCGPKGWCCQSFCFRGLVASAGGPLWRDPFCGGPGGDDPELLCTRVEFRGHVLRPGPCLDNMSQCYHDNGACRRCLRRSADGKPPPKHCHNVLHRLQGAWPENTRPHGRFRPGPWAKRSGQ